MGDMSGGVFRLLGALVSPLMVLYRWWRPVTDRAAIAALSDKLSAEVQEVEERLQTELRAFAHEFMPVEFTTPARQSQGFGPVKVKHIATFLEQLGRPDLHRRRVVVLGAPGSGKTVAATYSVLGLLKIRQELDDSPRANEPVPVRINAAGWDGQRDFTRWLIVRLGYDYRLRPNVARKMVERGLILPVIDGLDEMDTDSSGSRARALLDLLNRAPWRGRPVVVMCRTTEFTELTRQRGDNGLHGGTTLTLQPLDTRTVNKYLEKHQEGYRGPADTGASGWDKVSTHITDHPDGTLATCVQNPWMLGLTASTLRRTPDIAEQLISCPTETAVRDRLFAAQIPAAVAATDEGDETYRDYTEANVEKWMRSLAICLQRRRDDGRNGTAIRLDEVWEIAGINRIRVLHALVFALIFGLPFGFLSGVLTKFGFEFVGMSMGTGLFGVAFAVGVIKFPRPRRMAWRVPGPPRWRRGLKAGSLAGLGSGIVVGLLFGLRSEIVHGLLTGLLTGLMAGLLIASMVGAVVGLQVDARESLALVIDEKRIIRDDIQAATVATIASLLVSVIAGGLSAGLYAGVIFALVADPLTGLKVGFQAGLKIGFLVWLSFGLLVGLVVGLAAERFYLATLVFRFTKAMPSHPAVFLDWARRSGLLRVNGTAYQFRHDTYQQWIQQPHSNELSPPA
ncbi:NACHT domain-containing protein [Nocardia carnea]|uniref:NACHT domain-containing protein n=1 Tax=Nocardia carnea TaxID=37328 RepID=UPI0024576400|nr:hypothetical protein [Nocardia carnea]